MFQKRNTSVLGILRVFRGVCTTKCFFFGRKHAFANRSMMKIKKPWSFAWWFAWFVKHFRVTWKIKTELRCRTEHANNKVNTKTTTRYILYYTNPKNMCNSWITKILRSSRKCYSGPPWLNAQHTKIEKKTDKRKQLRLVVLIPAIRPIGSN